LLPEKTWNRLNWEKFIKAIVGTINVRMYLMTYFKYIKENLSREASV